jgi:cytochrome oxidase Cu insertion factor (SCO1/SenC/PrrC family)
VSESKGLKEWSLPVISVVLGIGIIYGLYHTFSESAPSTVAIAPAPAGTASIAMDAGTKLNNQPAPAFQLHNQLHQMVGPSQWQGKVVLLTFVNPDDTTATPLLLNEMSHAVKLLNPSARSQVVLAAVTANPTQQANQVLMHYQTSHQLQGNWEMLSGPDQTLKTVWRKYGVATSIRTGEVEESPVVYVLNEKGQETRKYTVAPDYVTGQSQTDEFAESLVQLLPSASLKSSVAVTPPTAGPPPSKLPVYENGRPMGELAYQSGKPQIDVFLASWATGLGAEMRTLEKLHQNDPTLPIRLIDVLPVESSLKHVATWDAKKLPAKWPLFVDTKGEVSEAYAVNSVPTVAIIDEEGDVAWSRNSFTPYKTLQKAIRTQLG